MRMKKLSARVEAMAGFVCNGETIADIGADHALLPIFLVREGVSPFAVLTDKAAGPLDRARSSVEKAMTVWPCAQAPFDLRLGDGLAALSGAEVDTVVIAGMGGETIISILEAEPEKARSFKKYILQPRTKAGLLYAWLENSGWGILAKTAAEEKGRLCDIIVCAPREGIS